MSIKKVVAALLLTIGLIAPAGYTASASNVSHTMRYSQVKQNRGQHVKHIKLIKAIHKHVNKRHIYKNWYRDGLSNKNFKARDWIVSHESGHHWNILSYGHFCVGYFQLDPHYLGYSHGRVNLNHKHQVKVADAYAKSRYGNWANAKRFWQAHHWY